MSLYQFYPMLIILSVGDGEQEKLLQAFYKRKSASPLIL